MVRVLTLHSHSGQCLIVPWSLAFNVLCCCGAVGVVGKSVRVLLGPISGVTMKAVICTSPFFASQTMATLKVAQWLLSRPGGVLKCLCAEPQALEVLNSTVSESLSPHDVIIH